MIHQRSYNNQDSAKILMNQAIENLAGQYKLHWPEGYYAMKINLAKIDIGKGNYDEALIYLQEAENYLYQFDYLNKISDVDYEKARAYFGAKKNDSALFYLKKTYLLAFDENQKHLLRDVYYLFAKIYTKNKTLDSAVSNFDKYIELESILLKDKQANSLKIIETGQVLKEAEFVNKEIREQSQKQLILFVIIIALSIVTIILIILRNHNNRKTLLKAEQKNKKLEDLNKKLDDASIAQTKYFEIIAHDLKSPTTAFKGSLEFMLNEFEYFNKDEIFEVVKDLHTSADHVQHLIMSLLTWARLKTGNFAFNQEPTDLRILVNIQTGNFIKKIENKRLIIRNLLQKNQKLNLDPKLFGWIVSELLENAIKFTQDAGEIIISKEEDLLNYYFIIQDNGIGITKSEQEKLFNLERTYSKIGLQGEKGTGLGLIICKGFLELHGGSIDIESAVDEGTKTKISLPKSFVKIDD